MREDQFTSRDDVIAEDGSVDVSSETSNGSRDTNMESDVFRRGRWRRPLSSSGINTNIYPSMDTRPIDVIFCPRQHDISALMMTLFWKVDIQFLGTSSFKRQHIYVVIFGEHRHLTDHLLDGTRDFQAMDWGVICFGYDGLFLLHYLLQLWGVMVNSCPGGFTLFYGLLLWAQHVHQLVTKIHVAWGDFLHSTLGLLKRMETSACCASLFDVLSSDIITHKFQEIGHCIILVLDHQDNYDHMSNKILFITIARSVLELLVRYYPSHIQGYAFVVRGMVSYSSTALERLQYHKMMIREYCPVKMRYFINLELLLSCEMNGEQVLLYKLIEAQEDTALGSQVVVRSPAAKIEFCHHQVVLKSLQDFAAQFYSHDSQDLADRIYIIVDGRFHRFSFAKITRGHRQYHILLRNGIINDVFMDRYHTVMITAEEYGERLLLRNTAEEYEETSSSTRLHHIICPSGDTSFCESYSMRALLDDIASREDTIWSQISDVKYTVFSAQAGYDIISLVENDAILVSIDGDTRHKMIARFASRIVGGSNQVNLDLRSDLVSYERHHLGLNHGERSKRVAIQTPIGASRNFALVYHEIIVIGSSITTRSNRLFDGFLLFIDIFARSAVQEILFVRTPDEYDQLQLHDKLQYQVADDCIYLEVQVTNGNRPFSQVTNGNRPFSQVINGNRPFANNHNALSSTFYMADLRLPNPKEEELLSLPSPKEEELLIQHPSPTGKINDYQELLEMPIITETTSHNNKFTARMFFEIVNYLLKWGTWNTTFGWSEIILVKNW